MKEVFLPKDYGLHYGSYPLELSVSSIEYEKRGNKRVPIGRQATLRAFIISSNYTDMQMKIDRVFEFFRSLGEFYVASGHTPFKLLKVSVDPSYTIDFGNTVLTDFEIPLIVHKPYFKQSLHTTLDIDSEGVRWNDKWGYGMGLSSDNSEWKYKFTNTNPRFYNAGTEDIKLIQQKESIITLIAREKTNKIEIVDENGTIFSLQANIESGMAVRIKGSKITLVTTNVLQYTNRNFLTVKKGWNNWEVRGINKFEIEFDFRFLYD